ncbi:unnamed protein product [Soboliphyme baturini]|uniref:Delta-like protein n=1 Tax=Soboliphyme baturini TaxID=241478 RepID=A0A183J4P5_9BILA|nr:unnamed protein product [Soboliphyme baturini]
MNISLELWNTDELTVENVAKKIKDVHKVIVMSFDSRRNQFHYKVNSIYQSEGTIICRTGKYRNCEVRCVRDEAEPSKCAWKVVKPADSGHGLCHIPKVKTSCKCPPCHLTEWQEWSFDRPCGYATGVRYRPRNSFPEESCKGKTNECCKETYEGFIGNCPCLMPLLCANGGTCHNLNLNDWVCSCPFGYTGKDCSIDIDECLQTDCSGHGRCANHIGYYICHCDRGYAGDDCEINVDDCQGANCSCGGRCVDGIDSYHCECYDGFAGKFCEKNIDDCRGVTCSGHGKCVDGIRAHTCTCNAGYTGQNCETGHFKLCHRN